ncbi:hypothetical protein [Nocardia farcinica]|uniref:hypothetical protein n=1 Tax=Nocardia farcinica TaxID=37329 RepID=UPI002456E49D|nr:hypothetical protein [Nocardia farcinica]
MQNLTAPQIVNQLVERVAALVVTQNPGATETEISEIFDRCFPVAWDKFLANLKADNPRKAAQFERALAAYITDN